MILFKRCKTFVTFYVLKIWIKIVVKVKVVEEDEVLVVIVVVVIVKKS